MKKKLLTGIIAALGLSLGVASCGDESSSIRTGDQTGHIRPTVQIDGKIITAAGSPESRANEDVHVTISEIKLKLTSADGSFAQEWESVDEFDKEAEFKVGDYTLEAYYGSEKDEGYSKPHFHGQQALTVRYDQTTDVALSATMKNSRVKVRYTDAFKDYMTAYQAQIVSSTGLVIDMPGNETSPAYVRPGTVTVNLNFTRHDGKNLAIEVAQFEAKERTEHVVTIDIAGGDAGSDATLTINFSDAIDTVTREINLSDELFDAPAPELTPEGWTAGYEFPHIENTAAPAQVKANILARGGIKSVILHTESSSLDALGWPQEIDLATASAAEQTLLTSLGLKALGVWKNPAQMAVVDFTDVFPNLGVGLGLEESIHTFSLQVKDQLGKISDVLQFSVKSSLGQIEIIWANAVIGRNVINAEVTYNGTKDLADATFTKRNLLGAWDNLIPSNIQPVDGMPGTYTLSLTAPNAIEASLTLRALFGSSYSDLDFEIFTPPFELIASPNDTFAKYAIVTVNCVDADAALVAGNLTFTRNGQPYDRYVRDGADIKFINLKPNTKYTFGASSANQSASTELTTEVDEHLPGCDPHDDDPDVEHSVGFGTWSSVKKGDYQYLWSTPGWATLNELTTSEPGSGSSSGINCNGAAYKATSGTIPANGRSTQSTAGGGGIGTKKNADGHTTGVAKISNLKNEHSGENAALIRTVAWGQGNSAHAGSQDNQGFGTGFHNPTPGQLYLGSYNNGPQYGVAFRSRPSALEFYYKYITVTSANGDYGTVEVTVYDADGVAIATGSAQLNELSAYRTKPETIALEYERGAAKAAKLSIIFKSSGNSDALAKNLKFWHTPGGKNISGGEYVGSELYIDDVRLIY